MKKIKLLRCLLFYLLIITAGCKKEKVAFPDIIIHQPLDGTAYSVGDTITVTATVSHSRPITSCHITLVGADLTAKGIAVSVPTSGSVIAVNETYIIENTTLNSGNYYLAITASDGENENIKYRMIYIHEIPKKLNQIIAITQTDSVTVRVFSIDSLFQPQFIFATNIDHIGSIVNSADQQLLLLGSRSGGFRIYSLNSYSTVLQVPPYNLNLPSFTSMAYNERRCYVAFYDGRIIGYDSQGQIKFHGQQPVYYIPELITVNDLYVIISGFFPGISQRKIVVINKSSGIARQELNISQPIAAMFALSSNELICFANDNGNAEIFTYNISSNGKNSIRTLSSTAIRAVAQITPDKYYLSTNQGLYAFHKSHTNLIPASASASISGLSYESINNWLFAIEGDFIKVLNADFGNQLFTIPMPDSVVAVLPVYNR